MLDTSIQVGGYADESEPLDLVAILDMVKQGGVNILSADERDMYEAFIEDSKPKTTGHYANLAESMDDAEMGILAMDIVNWVTWDEESRHDWSKREQKGIRMLGVSDVTDGGATFEGASKVVHPLLIEAVIQFQARAIAELMPTSGVVQTVIMGNPTPEIEAQAKRVEDYLNYLYMEKMPGAFEEMDTLLFRLPLSGSCFKKIYYDPLLDVPCSRFIESSDFIVPFTATDLKSAPRFTYRFRENSNSIKKKIAVGFYAGDVELYGTNSANESRDYPEVLREIDRSEGRERVQINSVDERHTLLECYVDLNIKGFEDKNEYGVETGIAVPYIVTVDRDNQRVLRVVRNYKPDDQKKHRTMYFSHYKFTPGMGFYGYGLLHMIGGLASSATGALRALLDSAQYANQQGGFKTRDSKIIGGDVPIKPGEWREVNSSAEELSKGFFPIPSHEPSQVLFNLLSYLDERAQRVASTTDAMVGDVPANQPVGTALQNMENGSKIFSAIHLRLHKAQNQEFRILAELVKDYIPEEGYPYLVSGAENNIMATDFDDRVDVIPVSDPNLISQSHRIAQAQGYLDLAKQFPQIINTKVAVQRMLEAMRVAGIEELMTPEPDAMQQQLQQLEIEKLKAEVARLTAVGNKETALTSKAEAEALTEAETTEKVKAERINTSTKTDFTAIEVATKLKEAQILAPDIVAIAQSIEDSNGKVDVNGSPLATLPASVQTMPQQIQPEQLPPMDVNTSPQDPALPVGSEPFTPEPNAVQGMDIEQGQNGIETVASEGLS